MPSGLVIPRLVALLYVMFRPIPQQILSSLSSIRHEPVLLFWIENNVDYLMLLPAHAIFLMV